MSQTVKIIVVSPAPEHVQKVDQALQGVLPDFQLVLEPANCTLAPACRWIDPTCLNDVGHLTSALMDAIRTIEATRHTFKSKQLGELRKRLQMALDSLSDVEGLAKM